MGVVLLVLLPRGHSLFFGSGVQLLSKGLQLFWDFSRKARKDTFVMGSLVDPNGTELAFILSLGFVFYYLFSSTFIYVIKDNIGPTGLHHYRNIILKMCCNKQ